MNSKDRGVETKSDALLGRQLGFVVCGGIGAVEVVRIIRELRRHGADVHPFLTPSVEKFVTALSIEWAAGRKPVLSADAEVEHLEDYDLVIVAPATLNTLVKASLGLADNAGTLAIASQLGARRPLLFYPTMNDRLKEHPRLSAALSQLESWGVKVGESAEEEGRRKMPTPEQVTQAAIGILR